MLKYLAVCLCFITAVVGIITGIGYIQLGMTPEIERACTILYPCAIACVVAWGWGLLDFD